jgi:mono/diheme cytochrome c family protein
MPANQSSGLKFEDLPVSDNQYSDNIPIAFRQVLKNHCLSCHDGAGTGGTDLGQYFYFEQDDSYQIKGLITANSLTNSKIYHRLKGANLSVAKEDMPLGKTVLSNEEKIILQTYISQSKTLTPLEIVSHSPSAVVSSSNNQLSGTCQANFPMSLAGDLQSEKTFFCSNLGTFTIPVILTLGDGKKDLKLKQIFESNVVLEKSFSLNLDTTPPTPEILAPLAGKVFNANISLIIKCEALLNITLSGDIENAGQIVQCPVENQKSLTIKLKSPDGQKIVQIAQTDQAGLTGTNQKIYQLDTVVNPPNVKIFSPLALSTFQSQIPLVIQCVSLNNVVLMGDILNAGQVHPCPTNGLLNVTASFNGAIEQTLKTISASQTVNGVEGLDTKIYNKDNQPPSLVIQSPTLNSSLMFGAKIQGTCENNLTIEISGDTSSTSTPCQLGTFSVLLAFSANAGVKNFQFKQTDLWGNVGVTPFSLLAYDSTNKTQNYQAAKKILEQHCFSCHTGQHYNLALITNEADWQKLMNNSQGAPIKYVLAGNPLNSPLYFELTGSLGTNGGKLMPSESSPLHSFELQTIAHWIQNTNPITIINDKSLYQSPRRMNREFLIRKLMAIFDFTKASTGILEAVVGQTFLLQSAFSGPCYNYAEAYIDDAQNKKTLLPEAFNTICPTAYSQQIGSNTPIIAPSTPYSAGWLSKTCELIVDDTPLLTTAVTKTFTNGQIGLTEANVSKAYQLFYPHQAPSEQVIQALIAIKDTESSNLGQNWKRVFYSLCAAGNWMIP